MQGVHLRSSASSTAPVVGAPPVGGRAPPSPQSAATRPASLGMAAAAVVRTTGGATGVYGKSTQKVEPFPAWMLGW